MTITFGFGEAIELLKYGKFTLLSLYGEIPKEDAVKITSIPMTEPPAVETVYGVKEGWVILTERYNWGSTSRPNKVYYELWNEPAGILKKIPMTMENVGFYCGAKIRESNIENRCTHLLCAGKIHLKLWNCSDPPEDVVYDFCVAPGTLVMVENGVKPIEKIEVGDKVLTHQGRYREVVRTFRRFYEGNLVSLKVFYAPKMLVTPEHPILVSRSGPPTWIPAKDLKVGDIVLLSFPTDEEDIDFIRITDFVKSDDLIVEDGKVYATAWHGGKNPKANPVPEIIPLSPEFLRLCGYYLAEGSLPNDRSIKFSFNIYEKKYVDDVKSIMRNLFDLDKPHERRRGRSWSLNYGCTPLARLFKKLFGKGAPNKRIHPLIMRLPRYKLIELLKGVFRGDGHTGPNQTTTRVKMRLSSPHLINQIRLILLKLGYTCSFRIGTDGAYEVYTDGYTDLSQLIFNKDYDRRWQKPHPRRGWIKNGFLYTPVREIKLVPYRGYVFNLEVAEDHSYNLLGCSTHNCVWFYTYRIRYHDEVMRVMRRTPMAIEEIAAILRKEGEIP